MLCRPPLDEASEEIPIKSDSSAGEALPPLVSFFFGKERNEVGAPKARHPAQRDKSEASSRGAG